MRDTASIQDPGPLWVAARETLAARRNSGQDDLILTAAAAVNRTDYSSVTTELMDSSLSQRK